MRETIPWKPVGQHLFGGWVLAGIASGALWLGSVVGVWAGQDVQRDEVEALVATLTLVDAPGEDRARAAGDLLSERWGARGIAAAESLLVPGEGRAPAPGRGAVLQAIAAMSTPPVQLSATVIGIANDPADPHRMEGIGALCAFRTREAASALLQIATVSEEAVVRAAAFRGLRTLSGRSDLGSDPDRWRRWLTESLPLTERQWSQQILESHVRRVAEQESQLEQGEQRLADAYRQIHLLTPVEQRSELLAGMLTSNVGQLQALGFDLANREIGESRVLHPVVAEAAIELLASSDPQIRTQAAILLDRLAPESVQKPLYAALERETDPRAADAMLRAASRWPSPLALGPVLRWLEGPVSVRPRAAGTAWALMRAGLVQEEADRGALLAGVKSIPSGSLNAAACRILVTLGGEEDLERLRELLVAPEPSVRTMVADALALRADQVEALLRRATEDPVLYEPTSKAIHAHMQDARGYDALARLAAPSAQVRARALAAQAALLPTAELVRLAKLASEPVEAIYLLGPLTAPERLADAGQASELSEGLLLLAETHAALGNPSEGLNAVSLVPDATEERAAHASGLRVMFLLWLNRIDQAEAIETTAGPWVDALEHAAGEPHAERIIERLEERFGEDLTETERVRLDAVRRRLAIADGEADGDGG